MKNYIIFGLFLFTFFVTNVYAYVDSGCMGNCNTGFTGSLSNQEQLTLNIGSIGNNGQEGTFLFSFYYHSTDYTNSIPLIKGVRLLSSDGNDAFACDIGSMSAVKNSSTNDKVAYIVTPVCKINSGQYADKIDIQFSAGVYGDYKTSLSYTFYSSDSADYSSILSTINQNLVGINYAITNSTTTQTEDLETALSNQTTLIINAINSINNSDIITNNNNNTTEIITNQNENAENIINSIDNNFNACVDKSQTFVDYDSSLGGLSYSEIPSCSSVNNGVLCFKGSYQIFPDGSEVSSSNNNAIIKFIPVENLSTIYLDLTNYFAYTNGNVTNRYYQWLDKDFNIISSGSYTSSVFSSTDDMILNLVLNVPTNAKYLNFSAMQNSLLYNNVRYNRKTKIYSNSVVCSNKLDNITDAQNGTTNAINDLNDNITNSNVDGGNSISDMSSSLADDSGIEDIFLLPVRLFQNVLNSLNSNSCSPINLGSLYGTNITFDCINIENILGSTIYNIIDLFFAFGLIFGVRRYILEIFEKISSLKEDKLSD